MEGAGEQWIRASVMAPAPVVAALEALFEDLGAVAVSLEDAMDQPLLEPAPGETPLWADVVVSGLFAATPDPRALLAAAAQTFRSGHGLALPEPRFQPLSDEDWTEAWRQHAVALHFPGFHLIAADAALPSEPGAVVRLAPGLAFGTGGHATTRGCLAALARTPPADLDVLDFGCGSGVLAIAALALGARSALAVDHDPQALLATRENAAANGVSERMEICEKLSAEGAFDLLVANVLARPLTELAPMLRGALRPESRAVLSGILPEQADAVRGAWPDFDFALRLDDGWVVLDGVRRS